MADKSIANLTLVTSMANSDYFVAVIDPAGVVSTNGVTKAVLFSNVQCNAKFATVQTTGVLTANAVAAANLVVSSNTPSSSTDLVPGGKIWWDTNYLYVAVANNSIKRIALSSF